MTFCCCQKRALRHKDADLAARNWAEHTKIQHMWMGCSKPHLPSVIFSTQIQYWVLQCGGQTQLLEEEEGKGRKGKEEEQENGSRGGGRRGARRGGKQCGFRVMGNLKLFVYF